MRTNRSPGSSRNRSTDCSLVDLTEQIANLDDSPLRCSTTGKRSSARSRDLHCDLVCFQLDERLSGRHCVALVLKPAEDRRFDDRFTQRWDFYR